MSKKNRTPVNLAQTALRLADQPALWEPLVEFDPGSRNYARLAAEPQFEAWLLTWVPGQGTDWHDHGGSAGGFVTLRGTLTEEHASVNPVGPPVIVPGSRALPTQTLRVFGTKHLHRVTNLALEPAVSLHVYAPALVEMNQYVPDGPVLRLVTASPIGVNW